MSTDVVLERGRAPGPEPARLDVVTMTLFDAFPTRSSARKACRRGEIRVDGEPREGAWWVEPGQLVERLEPEVHRHRVFPLPLEVLVDDPYLAVVVKPPGFRVNGNRHRTIEHALPANLLRSDQPDALAAPRPVHRLDAPTGGLLVCAKTATALAELGRAFQERRVHKRYRAICIGRLEGEGRVEVPVEGRAAASRYVPVLHHHALRTTWLTTVDLFPETGRTHQLRRHLASLGHPILGDTEYGLPGKTLRGKGLFLWAVELGLDHPITGERLQVETPEPAKFQSLRAREERRWQRWHGSGEQGAAEGSGSG